MRKGKTFSKNLGLLLCLIIGVELILVGLTVAPSEGETVKNYRERSITHLNFLTVRNGAVSVNSERGSKVVTQDEILCSSSPCMVEKEIYVYYYHSEHPTYCYSDYCETPIYDLAVDCLDLYDVYYFMIGFDAEPGDLFSDLYIFIDDQDWYFDTDWGWYRYENDFKYTILPAEEATGLDFYLTGHISVDELDFPNPDNYYIVFPNPDINCYLDCYIDEYYPDCYCENSKTYDCDVTYGDLYSYYIDFEDAVGDGSYWWIENVSLYLLHDSGLYETSLIKFPDISQIESAELVFDVSGSNPDELYEQGNLYVEVYDKDDNLLGMILDELITASVIKNIDIKEFLRDDGIKFVFGNDFGSEYIIENISIEFVARCSDGTLYGDCSETRPLYCEEGNLINNCQVCGCEKGYGCRTDGICVIFPADVDGNCKVDIFDLAAVGLCYGCSQGEGCWADCEQADLKSDGVINIFDLATVGLNYGKTC